MDFTNHLEQAMKHLTTDGAFLSTKTGDIMNTMTVSWGFIGFIWGKPHFITVVRPQRFTRPILDQEEDFTISIPFGSMKEALKIVGTKSGADFDKSSAVTFLKSRVVHSPIIDGCDVYYECKKIYVDQFKEESLPTAIKDMFYEKDYHHLYFGEIVSCYTK